MDYIFYDGGFYDTANRAAYEAAGSWPKNGYEVTIAERDALLAGERAGQRIVADENGRPVLTSADAPSDEQLTGLNVAAISAEMERQAKARGYDSMLSAISYATQVKGAPFQAEGAAFLAWRSAVWEAAFAVQAAVANGEREMPTPDQAVAEMPSLVLP